MTLDELQEQLDDVFGADEYVIEHAENGEIVIYSSLQENEEGELIPLLPDEDEDEDEEADPDFEPLEDEDDDLD